MATNIARCFLEFQYNGLFASCSILVVTDIIILGNNMLLWVMNLLATL